MTLGQKVREARIARGLTQKQLVGDQITRNMLSRIENDSATPSMRTLEYLAGRLGLPAGYFLSDSRWSDGTSPDGLDEMRRAYREGRFADCIALLEESRSGTTDEGYLLRSLASLSAARSALAEGRLEDARQYADAADYYNRQGMYYSVEIDAEMSLILAECSLQLDPSEFEANAADFEKAVSRIRFQDRYALARAEYLLSTGENELALRLLKDCTVPEAAQAKYSYLFGTALFAAGEDDAALTALQNAEALASDESLLQKIWKALEGCYTKREDYRMAYEYAAKRLK